MSKPIDGFGLAGVAIGSVLMYAGIKGYSALAVAENLVTGKPIFTGVSETTPLTTSGGSSLEAGGVSLGRGSGSGNQALGKVIAGQYGWDSGAEWDALVSLWNQESGWDNHAKNPSSGAYGIPQSLPYTKMPKVAWPESEGGSSDASAQITWGLDYIRGRYGSPTMAWAHEQANNWY